MVEFMEYGRLQIMVKIGPKLFLMMKTFLQKQIVGYLVILQMPLMPKEMIGTVGEVQLITVILLLKVGMINLLL